MLRKVSAPAPAPNAMFAEQLAAVGRWVQRSLRSLFPPIAWRRLRFRGGWFALPIYVLLMSVYPLSLQQADWVVTQEQFTWIVFAAIALAVIVGNGTLSTRRSMIVGGLVGRSEEHTSELQSLTNLVCRLLLEKKNITT